MLTPSAQCGNIPINMAFSAKEVRMPYRVRRAAPAPPPKPRPQSTPHPSYPILPPRGKTEWLPIDDPRPCPIPGCSRKRTQNGYPRTGEDGSVWKRVNARCAYHHRHGDDADPGPLPKGMPHLEVSEADQCHVIGCSRLRSYLFAKDDGTIVRHPVCSMHRRDRDWRALVPRDLFTPKKRHLVTVRRKPKPPSTGVMANPIEEFNGARTMMPLDRNDLFTWYIRYRQGIYTLAKILTFWERPNVCSATSQPRSHFRDEAQLAELFDWFDHNYQTAKTMAGVEG